MSNGQSVTPLPNIFIGTEKVNQRVELYLQNKRPLLSQALSTGGTTREETRSVWYSKEHIETLLNEIDLMNGDGIRIHFGAYENESDLAPGQLCLLMMITRAGQTSGTHTDIIYESEPNFNDRIQASSATRSLNKDFLDSDVRPKPFNYGAPCPPIC